MVIITIGFFLSVGAAEGPDTGVSGSMSAEDGVQEEKRAVQSFRSPRRRIRKVSHVTSLKSQYIAAERATSAFPDDYHLDADDDDYTLPLRNDGDG